MEFSFSISMQQGQITHRIKDGYLKETAFLEARGKNYQMFQRRHHNLGVLLGIFHEQKI